MLGFGSVNRRSPPREQLDFRLVRERLADLVILFQSADFRPKRGPSVTHPAAQLAKFHVDRSAAGILGEPRPNVFVHSVLGEIRQEHISE